MSSKDDQPGEVTMGVMLTAVMQVLEQEYASLRESTARGVDRCALPL